MTNTYTIHTGAFTTLKGEVRTMNFIRFSDLPSSIVESRVARYSNQNGFETVWDIDLNAFRTFNNATVQGTMTSRQGTYSFS
jgi:hypothetical protein